MVQFIDFVCFFFVSNLSFNSFNLETGHNLKTIVKINKLFGEVIINNIYTTLNPLED